MAPHQVGEMEIWNQASPQLKRAAKDFVSTSPVGSFPLTNKKHERYARLRAQLIPKTVAYTESGMRAIDNKIAHQGAYQLEKRPELIARIAWLSRQDEEKIKAKRERLEGALWDMHEADPKDAFINGKVRDLEDIPEHVRRAIEQISVDADGNIIQLKFSNKLTVNGELRKFLGLDKPTQIQHNINAMSDQELIQELSKQANELGVHIDLSYKFGEE